MDSLKIHIATAQEKFDYQKSDPFLIADLSEQKMYFIRAAEVVQTYSISGSKYGAGSKAGSNKTPLGFHKVKYKYGAGAAEGTIFKARQNTGKKAVIYKDDTDVEEDHVTTRILWLEGLEPGKNLGPGISSFERYIYIHGTPEEGLIGKPASHGCIRMLNKDVVELYEQVPESTLVLIVP